MSLETSQTIVHARRKKLNVLRLHMKLIPVCQSLIDAIQMPLQVTKPIGYLWQSGQLLGYFMQHADDGFSVVLTDVHRIALRTHSIGWG